MAKDETAQAAKTGSGAFEPVFEAARFALENADRLCDPAHGCGPYHKGWTAMRYLEAGGALPVGQAFLARHLFAGLGHDRPRRVLLAGSADTGLAALIKSVLAETGQQATIVIAERCATPLAQIRHAWPDDPALELHHCDIRELDCAPVDAILAHGFFHYVPQSDWAAVLSDWMQRLTPGGQVFVIHTLHEQAHRELAAGGKVREDIPAHVRALMASAKARGRAMPAPEPGLSETLGAFLARKIGGRVLETSFREAVAASGLLVRRWDIQQSPNTSPGRVARGSEAKAKFNILLENPNRD